MESDDDPPGWEVRDVSPERPIEEEVEVNAPITPFGKNQHPGAQSTLIKRRRVKEFLQNRVGKRAHAYYRNRTPVRSTSEPARKKQKPGNHEVAKVWEKFFKPDQFPPNTPPERKLEVWLDWKKQFGISLELAGKLSQRTSANFLFMSVGDEVRKIISAYEMMPEVGDVPEAYEHYTELITKLDDHFRDSSDVTVHLNIFSSMKQESKESARDFRIRLTRQAELCQLQNAQEFIRNRFVQGMKDKQLAERAFVDNWSFEAVVAAAARKEILQSKPEAFEPWGATLNRQDTVEVAALQTQASRAQWQQWQKRNMAGGRSYTNRFGPSQSNRNTREVVDRKDQPKPCANCGIKIHRFGTCPAVGKECKKCKKIGHFAVNCRSSVNAIEANETAGDTEEKSKTDNEIDNAIVACSLGGSPIMDFLIDSGADVNVLSEEHWELLRQDFEAGDSAIYDVENGSTKRIMAYAGASPLVIEKTFSSWIEVPGTTKPKEFAKFFVLGGGKRSLIGQQTATRMKLLKVGLSVCNVTELREVESTKPFPSVPGDEIEFDIDESVPPSKNAYYHVPAAFSDRARERLAIMEAQDIIERVIKAPKWISGMSAVSRGKSDFRLVVNMKGPNRAILRQYHRLPLLDEMKRKLHGAQWFTKLDLKNAFHHVRIGEQSRDLTTFMTETGMFRFKRLAFGVNCAPEIFQRIMESILQGIPGVLVFIDDILVYSPNQGELKSRTETVLSALKKNNLTLNTDKCEFDKERINFLGHELSKEGLNIDQVKVQAIQKFREPETPSELRSFLGLATYVSSYIAKFADMTAPLWQAVSKTGFVWEKDQKDAFEKTKQAIIECTIAQGYFSDSDDTIVYTDASPRAIGAVPVQTDDEGTSRIIGFASKALSQTEKRYPQTQREALAIVWSVEHYGYYLLGRHFTFRTDAQGIAFIFNRDTERSKRVLSRAEAWALRLSAYDFSIEYIKGNHNIADPSSRLYQGDDPHFEEPEIPWEIGALDADETDKIFSNERLPFDQIREETNRDDELLTVKVALETEIWPDSIGRYKAVKEQLVWEKEILTKLGAVVIPRSLRPKVLEIAHKGHPGMTAMKSIMRARVWWPNMAKQIGKTVKACVGCTLTSRREPPVPMKRSELPSEPWEVIAIDFNGPYARHGGILILVTVDCYSRYLSASIVKSTNFAATEGVLELMFGRLGKPRAIKVDNGPPFNGAEFGKYTSDNGIKIIFSTPLNPQQNGMVERYMQVINKAMQISSGENGDFKKHLADAIRAHNSAVHRITQKSPDEIMFGRKLRRDLPLLGETGVEIDKHKLRATDQALKDRAKIMEDRNRQAKDSELKVGDMVVVLKSVRAKGEPRFDPTPCRITSCKRGDFTVESSSGKVMKRNVTHLKRLHRRSIGDKGKAPEESKSSDIFQQPQQKSKRIGKQPQLTEPRRSARIAKLPKHFDLYVRLLESGLNK